MRRTDTSAQSEEMAGALIAYFLRFLALSPGLPLVLGLWSLATHLHDRFDAFPYLAITSPTKRCGKTRVCELLQFICHSPRPTVGISPAALYRLIQSESPTLLIDEAEYLGRKQDDRASMLREILNTGYRKGQTVYRCKRRSGKKGESFEPEAFKTYSPKVFVLIGKLQDTLADRCIEIRMERRAKATIERFRFARVEAETIPLRDLLESWAAKNGAAVEEYYQRNDVPSLQDREAELWLPLFSVCAIVAPHRLPELEAVAKRLAHSKAADEPGDYHIQMLQDVRDIFWATRADRLPTAELLTRLNALEEAPWAEWNDGRGLNAHSLSRVLQPFRIHPQNIRYGGRVAKGYLRESLGDSWDRYLGEQTATQLQTAHTQTIYEVGVPLRPPFVADTET